jgi:hypothetical protein
MTELDSFLTDVIRVLEQCPVTSETDWIVRRNDLIVRARNALRRGRPSDEELTTFFIQNDWNFISPETFCDIANAVLDTYGPSFERAEP